MQNIVKKSEKLASAVYLVTSFFSDKEPLKWRFRTLVSDILSLAIPMQGEHKEREKLTIDSKNKILEVISCLNLAKNSGLMSDNNYSILHQEFTKYGENLDSISNNTLGVSYSMISPKFFEENNYQLPSVSHKEPPSNNQVIKDKISYQSSNKEIGKKIELSKPKPKSGYMAVSMKKNNRQDTILNVLRQKQDIMIKDISSLIDDCSEKTIQRELQAMVASGVIKKTGEKRWSRYSLA